MLPIAYQWQYNLRCLTPDEVLTNSVGKTVPEELPGLLTRSNWLSTACAATDIWVNIPGATNDTLTLKGITVEHTGQYRLVAANIGASGSVTSAPTRVVVSPLPLIVTNLPTSLKGRECDRRELYYEVDGGCYPVTYEWYFNGARIPGISTNLFVFTNGHPTQSGAYFAVGRGPYGGTTSVVCQVTFDATPIIKTQPRSLSAPAKDCDALALSVDVEPACRTTLFQWQLNGIDIPTATNRLFSFKATAETAGDYRVRLYNEYATNVSEIAKVPVDSNPYITEHPEWAKPKRFLVGATFTNVVKVQSCSELTFQWRLNGKEIPGDLNHTVVQTVIDEGRSIVECSIIVGNASLSDAGRYDVIVTSRGGSVTSRGGDVEIYYRPPNDDFINRILLASSNFVVSATNFFSSSSTGTNILASSEPLEPDHARQPARRSIWWTWTAPAPCLVTVDTVGSDFDTLLSVYTGDELGSLRRLVDDDQSGGNNSSRATFLAARGRVVHFAVDGSGGAEGKVQLHLKAEEIVSPPIILKQPSSLAATNGATAEFSVDAFGSPDILYQWSFNGVPIRGATNSSMTITNVQEAHEGNYTVFLQNEYGNTNSFIARLTFGIIIEGQVTDATNRRGVPGATVSVGSVSTITDTNGNYILVGVRPGKGKAIFDAKKRVVRIKEAVQFNNQTTLSTLHLHAEKHPEYIDYDDYQFSAKLGQTVTNKFSMSPIFEGVRFVLNWGLEPADLDAHLLTPPINGESFHVWYPETSRGSNTAPPFAFLDQDVRDSYGPETLTIHRLESGIYRFYIKKFDPGAKVSLSASKASVKVYTRGGFLGEDGLYASREVPLTGNGSVWNVCDIDGTRRSLTWADEILQADPPSPSRASGVSSTKTLLRSASLATATPRFPGVRFEWEFGDGEKGSEIEPTHRYLAPGFYTVKLSVFANGSGELLDSETKTNFIRVYNEPPVVRITSPNDGKLLRYGVDVPIEAEVSDLDGDVKHVEFLAVSDGVTNALASVEREPYSTTLIKPLPKTYTLVARAVDDFGGIGLSEPVTVRILDLDGDILIIRNFADSEIDSLAEYLLELQIPDGPLTSRSPEVRVLDQEGLYLDLIRHFKLIIWDDLGRVEGGIGDFDAELLYSAKEAGIPLYLLGDHIAGSLSNLSSSFNLWQELCHLQLPTDSNEPGLVSLVSASDNRKRFFRPYGAVAPFTYDGKTENALLSATNVDTIVSSAGGTSPIMVSSPPFQEPDYGFPRSVTQNFRVVTGSDEDSLQSRKNLFLNAAAWLLRLSDCDTLGLNVLCNGTGIVGKVGEPLVLSAVITQNGECDAGGVILTNFLSPDLELQSFQLVSISGTHEAELVRQEAVSGGLVTRFAQLSKDDLYQLNLSVIPRAPGLLTNRYSLYFRPFRPQALPCEQIVQVASPIFNLSSVLSNSGDLHLTIAGGEGLALDLEISTDLKIWKTFRKLLLNERQVTVSPVGAPQSYFRLKNSKSNSQ